LEANAGVPYAGQTTRQRESWTIGWAFIFGTWRVRLLPPDRTSEAYRRNHVWRATSFDIYVADGRAYRLELGPEGGASYSPGADPRVTRSRPASATGSTSRSSRASGGRDGRLDWLPETLGAVTDGIGSRRVDRLDDAIENFESVGNVRSLTARL
jgi:hypothetical protein